MGFLIFLGIVGAVVFYFISIYNNLVALRQSIQNSWADIEVLLKRRFNLIPALVDTVKGYKNYEQETLEKVIKARNNFINSDSMEGKIAASNMISKSMGSIFALAEAYPDLKANQNFMNLQQEISKTEDIISNARRYFNASVREYNTKIASFPDLLVANRFNFTPLPYFELEDEEREEVHKMPKIEL